GSGSDWPYIDSYDSSNPDYSSTNFPGGYDPSERKDTAFVVSLSPTNPAINTGSGAIWGSAATAPGGTVIGTVGDGLWCLTQTGIQPNHVRDDCDLVIPDAVLPSVTWVTVPPNFILGNNNYKITGDLTTGLSVVGKARLWVTGDVKLSGFGDEISINNGRSLELFIGTATGTNSVSADFGGGLTFGGKYATNFTIWGLPTCTSMKFSSSPSVTARIYAPQADVQFRGGADGFGAFTAKSFTLSGSCGIHIDEALAR
ncbi:MAG TPA: collagen-binding domain-containing protein, partial [Verrucomicrobiae bacterium]